MKRALVLLLLAACGSAGADAPSSAAANAFSAIPCDAPVFQTSPEVLARASEAMDGARVQPGPQNLGLARALANLAQATALQQAPQAQRDANRRTALDLVERAQAIWNAAPADAALAQDLQRRARIARNTGHCALALPLYESALSSADKAQGEHGALALSVVRELMLLAAAIGDDPTMNTLAPRLLAALDADPAPFDDASFSAYLALIDHYYRGEDHERAEMLVNALGERAHAAPAGKARLVRLNIERASIYYGQGRYTEAEALRPPPAHLVREADPLFDELKRTEDEMVRQVRSGRLREALAMGEAALARIEAGRAASASALEAAQAQWEAARKEARRDAMVSARTRRDTARRDVNTYAQALPDMQGYVGEIQHALGRLDLALPLYEAALRNYPAAPATARGFKVAEVERVRGDLALVYRAQGDRARALALQQEVRATLLPLLGPRHPDVREAEREVMELSAEASAATAAPALPAPAPAAKRKK